MNETLEFFTQLLIILFATIIAFTDITYLDDHAAAGQHSGPAVNYYLEPQTPGQWARWCRALTGPGAAALGIMPHLDSVTQTGMC
eukprot:32643-Rhodomonas_salina.2